MARHSFNMTGHGEINVYLYEGNLCGVVALIIGVVVCVWFCLSIGGLYLAQCWSAGQPSGLLVEGQIHGISVV